MDRDIRLLGLAALAAAILHPALAGAQAPPSSKPPVAPKAEQLDPKACANRQDTVGLGSRDGARSDSTNLSDKLARSDGVICPPERVDPDIRQPAPESGGPMPVIPPPGSPGGDPSVRPK